MQSKVKLLAPKLVRLSFCGVVIKGNSILKWFKQYRSQTVPFDATITSHKIIVCYVSDAGAASTALLVSHKYNGQILLIMYSLQYI